MSDRSQGNTLDVDAFGIELVKEYEEFDLFEGLFTEPAKEEEGKKKAVKLSYEDAVKRTTPVKVSYAFCLPPLSPIWTL